MKLNTTIVLTLTVMALATQTSLSQNIQKPRLAVLSGGGAYGSWGVGVMQYLHETEKREYTIAIGTSTGSLMAPLVLLNKYDELDALYRGVSQNSIFNVNPVNSKGEIRALNALWRFITGRATLGESKPLRQMISNSFTKSYYDQIKNEGKELIVTSANMTEFIPYYFSTNNVEYDSKEKNSGGKSNNWNSMVNWIWASANEPIYMSLFKTDKIDQSMKVDPKKNAYWCDGGVISAVSLSRAIQIARDKGILDIDVLVHGTKEMSGNDVPPTKIMKGLSRTISILAETVKQQNVEVGVLLGQIQKVSSTEKTANTLTINIYYMKPSQYNLLANSLVFIPDIMKKLNDSGRAGEFDSVKYTVEIEDIQPLISRLKPAAYMTPRTMLR